MNRAKFLVLAIVATVSGTKVALTTYDFVVHGLNPSKAALRDHALVQASIKRHIEESTNRSLAAIRLRSDEFRSYIQSRKGGAKPFSTEVVSIYGKWRAVKGKLPFTDSEGHKKYVIEQFDQHIFSPHQLGDKVKSIIESSARDVEQEQNNLAVAIRTELLGRPLEPRELAVARGELTRAMDQAVSEAKWGVAKDAAGVVVTEVTSNVATQVLVRVGVASGVLTAGTATSWWTFGAGLAIGFVVSWLWDKLDDPAGKIQANVEASLNSLGVRGAEAIQAEMARVVDARRALWLKSAEKMLGQ